MLEIDSNVGFEPSPPAYDPNWLTVGSGSDDGVGAAVVRVIMKNISLNGTTSCPNVNDPRWSSVAGRRTALVTGQARTTIDEPLSCPGDLGGVGCPNINPDVDSFEVALTGAPFQCGASGPATPAPGW